MNAEGCPERAPVARLQRKAVRGPAIPVQPGDNGESGWSAALISDLQVFDGLRVRANGLLLPPGMSFDVWQRVGGHVLQAAESISWWVGDWLVFGQHTYGERYQQAIAQTSLDYQTLRNYAWVAKKFPLSRRRDTLSLGHHSEVAALTEAEQDTWLARAERFGWSRNELRRRLRAARQAGRSAIGPAKTALTHSVKLKVSAQQHDRWRAAAEQRNRAVDDWIVETLDQAARSSGPADHLATVRRIHPTPLARNPRYAVTQQVTIFTGPVSAESPWVAAMVRYVTHSGRIRSDGVAPRLVDLTRRIETSVDAGDRAALRRNRAECWEALAAATDQTDPGGQLCALACRCAAALDRVARD